MYSEFTYNQNKLDSVYLHPNNVIFIKETLFERSKFLRVSGGYNKI